MEPMMPLRYKISSWRQLPQCISNNSRQLHIRVTDFIQDARLSGFRIKVEHDDFGTLFACVLQASGSIITRHSDTTIAEFTPAQVLAELEKYGFFIVYNPEANLSGDQIQYLMTLKNLHFDKLRVLNVWETDPQTGAKLFKINIVAFNADKNSYWLNNDYSPPKAEFTEALNNGSAANLTAISETKKYSWSWLAGFVANIDDVIQDNAEVKLW